MNARTLWKSLLLSLTLMAPPALAQEAQNEGTVPTEGVGNDAQPAQPTGEASAEGMPSEAGTPEAGTPAAGKGVAFGARLGFGLPFGKLAGGEGDENGSLGDVISGIIPVQLEAGYFLNENLYLGASFQHALALVKDCEEGADCSASVLRFGLNAAYHLQPMGKLTPWVGLGIGYERLSFGVSTEFLGDSFNVSVAASGLEFAALQGGADYRINNHLTVGPFVTFTAGQYSSASVAVGDEEESNDIEEKAFHFWLMAGVRLQFRLL